MKKMLCSLLLTAFMASSLAIPAFAHNVEFVVLGAANVRFQYADGQPMSNAEIRVLDENMELVAVTHADAYGVFNYEAYLGIAARLEARHNNHTVRFIFPAVLPRVVHNDRGELVETVVPAGSGGRLSATSLVFTYIGAAVVIGYAALFAIKKRRGRKPTMTVAETALSRRMPRQLIY